MSEAPIICPRCGGYDPFHPDTPRDAPRCTPITCSAWKKIGVLRKGGHDLMLVGEHPEEQA